MSIATMEEEIVGVTLRLNQAMRAISKTPSFIALRGQGSYFKIGSLFVGLTWLLTGISEGKIYS